MECSICGRNLKYLGTFGGAFSELSSIKGVSSSPSDFDMWKVQVCTTCKLAFCEDCLELGRPTPCPECGKPTEPAYRGTIHAIGEPKKIIETEIFYGYSDGDALEKAYARNIPKEQIVMLQVTKSLTIETTTGRGRTISDAVKNCFIPKDAFEISKPLIKNKGFFPFKKWIITISYKMPAEVKLRYRIM